MKTTSVNSTTVSTIRRNERSIFASSFATLSRILSNLNPMRLYNAYTFMRASSRLTDKINHSDARISTKENAILLLRGDSASFANELREAYNLSESDEDRSFVEGYINETIEACSLILQHADNERIRDVIDNLRDLVSFDEVDSYESKSTTSTKVEISFGKFHLNVSKSKTKEAKGEGKDPSKKVTSKIKKAIETLMPVVSLATTIASIFV